MTDGPARAQALLAALRTDAPLRREGVGLAVDHLLATKVAALVDPGEAAPLVVAAVTPELVERAIGSHLSPAWDRIHRRADETGETLADHLPPNARERIHYVATHLRPPEAAWARGAIDGKLVSKLLAPVVQDTLLAFARKLPGVGLAADGAGVIGGLAGAFRKRVEEKSEKLGDARKKVTGALDKRLMAIAKEFSQGALAPMQKALLERLASDEGRELIERITHRAVDSVLDAPLAALMTDAEVALPREELESLVADVAVFDAARDEILALVRGELAAAFEVEGQRPVGALLDDAGVREAARELLIARIDALAVPFLASEAVEEWLGRVLDAG